MARRKTSPSPPSLWRQYMVLAAITALFATLGAQVVALQVEQHEMLQSQGDKRYLRDVRLVPERGKIVDRNDRVLAVSTPVDALVAEPGVFCREADSWGEMPAHIGVTEQALHQRCKRYRETDFMYVKRWLPPHVVASVMAMDIPGLEVRREYKRYFPGGPISAHLIGFTDTEDRGQEGLELAYDEQLRGRAGKMRVLKALTGHYVEAVESIHQAQHGTDLRVSIDQRIQALASGYLEEAVHKHQAAGGSVVVLAVPSGELIAMVNSPQFNPNDRQTIKDGVFRNRSVTDVIEPGSTAKPFIVAMALEGGEVTPETMIDTTPGKYRVGGHTVTDIRNYGELSVADIIVRSSNIGSVKLALERPFDEMYDIYRGVGFGQPAGRFPGETNGVLKRRDRRVEHATQAYGYGLAVTPLQLARAYTVFATDGELLPVTLEKKAADYRAPGVRVLQPETVIAVRAMLEQALAPEGVTRKAWIPRYRVGGKTGTTHKLGTDGNYAERRYVSLFAGLGPISAPRFVVVVVIDDPRGGLYYGGDVAAPVFAPLMTDLMRLYNIEPDGIDKDSLANNGRKRA